MSDRYAATGSIAVVTATPGDTALTVFSSGTTRRGYLYELDVSHGAVPADNVIQWLLRRLTALGTEGAGVVPAPLDIDAPGAILDAGEDFSAEPTYTAATELIDQDVNQRATYRWVASPGGEFVIPAVANAGLGITPIAAVYAGIARATVHWEE